jgi:hypothetical protein
MYWESLRPYSRIWMLQGMLSDGRPLLMAVAPDAGHSTKAAAMVVIGLRVEAFLVPSGARDATLHDDHLLPWQAFHLMAYMVRTCVPTVAQLCPGLLTCVHPLFSRPQQRMCQALNLCSACRQHWTHCVVPPRQWSCLAIMHCAWHGRRPPSR